MKLRQPFTLTAIAVVVAGLSGMASLIVRAETPHIPAAPGKPVEVQALPVKPVQIPSCADQDDDDDRDELKSGKPDTDDIELQCGDQNDDDDEIEDDDAPGKRHERESHEQRATPHTNPVKAVKKVNAQ